MNDEEAISRRIFLGLVGAGAVSGGLAAYGARGEGGGVIAGENRRPGDQGWAPRNNSSPQHHLEGYTTAQSVSPGEKLGLCVSAKNRYTIEFYRVGWYGGAGGRKVAAIEGGRPKSREVPSPEGPNNLLRCDWPTTDTITVGDDWASGLYYARFVSAKGEYSTVFPFVVRERTPSAHALVVLPMNTMQAYNYWGADGGSSLYGNHGAKTADEVSFDRPYNSPYACHIGYAIHLIRWMEREGYDVSYVCDFDLDREPKLARKYRAIIIAGHSEYWSKGEYDGFEDAQGGGVHTAVMGGNMGMWEVRFRDGGRVMACDKDNKKLMWRNHGRPEANITGLMGSGAGLWRFADFTVEDAALNHPWMRDTGFRAGDRVVGCIGHEWDFLGGPSPDDAMRIFHYEGGTSQWSGPGDKGGPVSLGTDADAIRYEKPSGAVVFNCASLGYPWRLDPDPTWDNQWPYSRVIDYKPQAKKPDARLQRFQKNVFDDLLNP